MSVAGIRSNRGDVYQTLVAFDWALTVLSDPNALWLEIDSVKYEVDDVVVGRADGTFVACQCKKNQPDFKAWSIGDLADELKKASRLLVSNASAEVLFYSRSNFGDLAKLREHSSTQASAAEFQSSLSAQNRAVELALKKLLEESAPNLSSFDFLRRTKFETSGELERMEEKLRERLRSMASNLEASFSAIWGLLDQLGARIGAAGAGASRHRLTKDDLLAALHGVGALLVPPLNLTEVTRSFADASAIGRSWRRDIAGERIATKTLEDLLSAIDEKKAAILLTGLPGSGKTCVMLELQEALEKRAETDAGMVPLFIQSREFADLTTVQDRRSQGLPDQWVEKAARLAEEAHVVVVIDSLDVLSIARDHRVLTYFLAQIDRLLKLRNVSVVTACREFDRHYDRRIAERSWDCEIKCQRLEWEKDVAPLLDRLGIAGQSIDATTRELIRNPRELALFVELARREGSFNIVTEQALAKRYLDTVVRGSVALGDVAVEAIEKLAADMLSIRSLAVPYQRFGAPPVVVRELCSLNVIQEAQDGRLTFGHQTLLDVLVTSGAMRAGVTLAEFIGGLPPVPFVRPSVRSYVAQLALGDRREFRKQVRAVLMGDGPFHVRRLVAESFAEQPPRDDDWPLIRDLRQRQRDVFQVIYAAKGLEWHYFWLKHLIPVMRLARDAVGMTAHVNRVGQWGKLDPDGVVSLWADALSQEWLDRGDLAYQIGFRLSDVDVVGSSKVVPLLERLLNLPRFEHGALGRAIGRCVASGVADDSLLWRYITSDIDDENVLDYKLSGRLRCAPHEFGGGGDDFVRCRMEHSEKLLDLAIDSIEAWSQARSSRYGESCAQFRRGFLDETSYEDAHRKLDIRGVDSMDVLFDAVEAAIILHAQEDSSWWKSRRERLVSTREGALLYFSILACMASPNANVDLIERLLCERDLMSTELSYEVGNLLKVAYVLLDERAQHIVSARILSLHEDRLLEKANRNWIMKERAELISLIPCHLRLQQAQATLDEYEREAGWINRQPDVRSCGGIVSAPFSYEVFIVSDDASVLRLMRHYIGHKRYFDDYLVGGEREVGSQLREASSRDPSRFIGLLVAHWLEIPSRFRDDIMDGAATYLAHRYGNLQPNGNWEPFAEPEASALAGAILDELERHSTHWWRQRSAAKALEACSNVIYDAAAADRLTFLAIGFEGLHEEPLEGNDLGLISVGINMVVGDVADALMIVASNLSERGCELPELLVTTLCRFARNESPAIRALVVRRSPYLQAKAFSLGWELFNRSMRDSEGLWEIAEPCLYYSYHRHFEIVKPLLAKLRDEGRGKSLETWGRISALAALDGQISYSALLDDLKALNQRSAWKGAATVWTHLENVLRHREQCLDGLNAGLNSGLACAQACAVQLERLLDDQSATACIPVDLVRRLFAVLRDDAGTERKHHRLFGFHRWLNATSHIDAGLALASFEIYLEYLAHCKPHVYDLGDNITQLMTRLFAEAEELEESDGGLMLQRVVRVQDELLLMGLNGVDDWLKAAERRD